MCAHPPASPPATLDVRRQRLVLCRPARAMARRIAARFSRGRCPEDRQDYQMAALSGLIEAAALFDFNHPLTRATLEESFCGFAYAYGLRAVTELASQGSSASTHLREYVSRLRRMGHDPADPRITDRDEALARQVQMRPDTVSRKRREIAAGLHVVRHVPLMDSDEDDGDAEEAGREDRAELPSDAPSAPSAEETAISDLRDAAVRDAIAALPRELRSVMTLRCEGWNRCEIAEQMGLPYWRVCDLASEGFARLRTALADYA